jgi:hypothetical protein
MAACKAALGRRQQRCAIFDQRGFGGVDEAPGFHLGLAQHAGGGVDSAVP